MTLIPFRGALMIFVNCCLFFKLTIGVVGPVATVDEKYTVMIIVTFYGKGSIILDEESTARFQPLLSYSF